MTERHTGERFRHPNVRIEGGPAIIPAARRDEIFPITLTPFMDHGRRAFITSTIRSSSVLVDAANELIPEESQRLTAGAGRILEELLDGHPVRGATVLTSTDKERPNIYVVTFGDPFNPSGLRLYFHHGVYNRAPVLYQDARTRIKNADKVEKFFAKIGNYSAPKGWDIKRKSS